MPLVITISGDETVIEQGLDAYVRYNGYTDKVPNDNHDPDDPDSPAYVDNPVTKLEWANKALADMFRRDIKAYNVIQSQAQAAEQASTATDDALDLTSVSTEVVSG